MRVLIVDDHELFRDGIRGLLQAEGVEGADSIFEAIKSGAQGYLLKNMRAAEFISLLKGVERGEAAITSDVASKILEAFSRRARGVRGERDAEELTERELEVLRLVVEGHTNRKIGGKLGLSENT